MMKLSIVNFSRLISAWNVTPILNLNCYSKNYAGLCGKVSCILPANNTTNFINILVKSPRYVQLNYLSSKSFRGKVNF